MAKNKANQEPKEGDQLEYVGRGFLSFDKSDTKMVFIEKSDKWLHHYWVKYKDIELLVRDHEVKTI